MKLTHDNCRLYLITDRRFKQEPVEELVEAAIKSGVSMVQYREKQLPDMSSRIALGNQLKTICKKLAVPLIINDRVDLCMALDADGVHLGRKDMPVSIARRLLGKDKIIGATVSNVNEARAAVKAGADYLGVGAMFATRTKPDHSPVIGFEGLRKIAESVNVPLVAIGGIDAENAQQASEHGASGVAVVSAILNAASIERASRNLRSAVERGLSNRPD